MVLLSAQPNEEPLLIDDRRVKVVEITPVTLVEIFKPGRRCFFIMKL